MKRRKLKKGYVRKSGKFVKSHSQNYTYKDFAKMRLKKILASQKQKNVVLAMKQMGREWQKAKVMNPEEIKKTFGSLEFGPLSEDTKEDRIDAIVRHYSKPSAQTKDILLRQAGAIARDMKSEGYSKPNAQALHQYAKALDMPYNELYNVASKNYET